MNRRALSYQWVRAVVFVFVAAASARGAVNLTLNVQSPVTVPYILYIQANASSDAAPITKLKAQLDGAAIFDFTGEQSPISLLFTVTNTAPGTTGLLSVMATDKLGNGATQNVSVVFVPTPKVKIAGLRDGETVYVGETLMVWADVIEQPQRVDMVVYSKPLLSNWMQTSTPPYLITFKPDMLGPWQITAAPYTTNYGTLAPDIITLNVVPFGPPQFIEQPYSTAAALGATASFSAKVSSGDDMKLQWFHDGSRIDGATNLALSLSNISAVDQGRYSLQAENSGARTLSEEATLEVQGLPHPSGGRILFANKTTAIDAPIRSGNDNSLLNGRAQLYAGPKITEMIDVSGPRPLINGYVSPVEIALPNVGPGEKAYVQICAWETDGFSPNVDFTSSFMRWKSMIIEVTAGSTAASPLVGLEGFSTVIWDGYSFGIVAPFLGTGKLTRHEQATLGTSKVLQGPSARFTWTGVVVTNISHRWFKNGIELSGQTNSLLSLPNVRLEDAGNYTDLASDGMNVLMYTLNLAVSADAPILKPRQLPAQSGMTTVWELIAPTQRAYRLETSSDLKTWSTWKTGTMPGDTISVYLSYTNSVESVGGAYFRAVLP
jgi:hypothetical protein